MSEILDQFDRIPGPQKLALLLLVAVGIFVAFYFIVYSGQQEDIDRAKSRLERQYARQAELMAEADDIERVRAEVAQQCEWQQVFVERLPIGPQIEPLLVTLQQQAQIAAVSLEVQDISGASSGRDYMTIPMAINVQGTYDQISDFFYGLSRQPRIMNIRNINLARSASTRGRADEAGGPILRAQFNLATYYTDPESTQGVEACN